MKRVHRLLEADLPRRPRLVLHGSWTDGLLPVTTFFSSVPYFWLGIIAIYLLAGPDSFFPSSGGFDSGLVPAFDQYFVPSAIRHSLLPALTILISSVSGWILSMRNMMVTVASEDYITVAHAKGLSERRVAVGYAARNASRFCSSRTTCRCLSSSPTGSPSCTAAGSWRRRRRPRCTGTCCTRTRKVC